MKKVKAFIERSSEGHYFVYIDLEEKTLGYGIHVSGYRRPSPRTTEKIAKSLARLGKELQELEII